jgi:hypothetical protein
MIISNLYGLIMDIKHILFCVPYNFKNTIILQKNIRIFVIFITVVVYTHTQKICVCQLLQRDYAICR